MSLTGEPKTSVSSQIDGKMYPSSAVSVSVVKDFATALVLGSDPSDGLEFKNELPELSPFEAYFGVGTIVGLSLH